MIDDSIIQQAKAKGRTVLNEIESKQIIKQAGIEVVDAKSAKTRDQAISISKSCGFPVVMKIMSPDLVHKSDSGGVRLNLNTADEVGEAYDEMISSFRQKYPKADLDGMSVQKMVPQGLEVIIGMFKDVQFGPVMMFGLGGVFVEVLKDVSFRIVPLTPKDSSSMIREIKGYKLLEGYRGKEAVDIRGLEDLLIKLSEFVQKTPEINELDLNPVFVYGSGASVVDARIIL